MTELLVFARCAGFVFRAPGFSHPSVPSTLRGGFALLLTIAIAPWVTASHVANVVEFIIALCTEFLLGSAIGMAASLVYDGAYAGGRVVDDYVGVKAIAPSLALVAPSGFGRVWSLAFTGAFFLSGAYRVVLLGFTHSFTSLPPSSLFQAGNWGEFAAAFATTIVAVALAVAAPAIGSAFVMHIALGTLSRVIPRFGSFTLAFPLAFAAALVVTAISVPWAAQHAPEPILTIP
ncbi:MAG: flagellar biosynthetic protein FliR [Candidatus Cybelea sp.]